MARESMIELVVPDKNMKQSFSFSHAERLLKMKNNGGWVIPADSKYEFNCTDNAIKLRTNKRDSAKTDKKTDNKQSCFNAEETQVSHGN